MNIVIIGAGAAGLTAAISASLENSRNAVYLVEHSDRVGKKILSTGNGKCNLTNENMSEDFYRCDDISVVKKVLDEFGYNQTIDFFRDLGLFFKNRNGYIYPYSGQASSVLDVLRHKCESLSVKTITEATIKNIDVSNGFKLHISNDAGKVNCINADKVIIATGSKASNLPGADDSGYRLAEKLGHSIIEPLPALTGLKCSDKFCKSMAGVRCDGEIKLFINDDFAAADVGEIQLTDYGVSGIPVFQISRYATRALHKGCKVTARVDFIPQYTENKLKNLFDDKLKKSPEKTVEEQLIGVVNKKIASVIIKISGKNWERIIHNLKEFEFHINGFNSFEQAQICTGGINISEIEFPSMESKICKNLFFAGEIIDVDGMCGGYNLQWAWATGFLAGRSASC